MTVQSPKLGLYLKLSCRVPTGQRVPEEALTGSGSRWRVRAHGFWERPQWDNAHKSDHGCTSRGFGQPPAPVSSGPQILPHQAQTSQCAALGWNEELCIVSGFCQQPREKTSKGLARCCSPSVSSRVRGRRGEQLLLGNLKAGASEAEDPADEALASLRRRHAASEMSSHLGSITCQSMYVFPFTWN